MAIALQGGIRAIALPSQTAVLSAFANDADPEGVYAQLAWNYARPGDCLIAVSTSGGAVNVRQAARAARLRGAKVIALTGERESELGRLADAAIRVPARETYRVQEYHLPVYHWLCAVLEDRFFAE